MIRVRNELIAGKTQIEARMKTELHASGPGSRPRSTGTTRSPQSNFPGVADFQRRKPTWYSIPTPRVTEVKISWLEPAIRSTAFNVGGATPDRWASMTALK